MIIQLEGMYRLISRSHIFIFFSSSLILYLFFFDFLHFGRFPVTSADPAINFWSASLNSTFQTFGDFPLWDRRANIGRGIFNNDIALSPFSAVSLFYRLFEDWPLAYTAFIFLEVLFLMIFYIYYLNPY